MMTVLALLFTLPPLGKRPKALITSTLQLQGCHNMGSTCFANAALSAFLSVGAHWEAISSHYASGHCPA